MVHPKGLTDKAVTDILLNSDSEEDFGSELSESESEYESQSDSGAEDKLPMGSVDATIMWKKQRVEEWKWNPSRSSRDKPTKKPFHGVPGINSNTGRHYQRRRGLYVCNLFMETDFWLHLVAQVNKYAASITVQNDPSSSNSSMESKWFDTTIDELMTFIFLYINYASR